MYTNLKENEKREYAKKALEQYSEYNYELGELKAEIEAETDATKHNELILQACCQIFKSIKPVLQADFVNIMLSLFLSEDKPQQRDWRV